MAYYKIDKKYAERVISDMRLRNETECGHVLLSKKDLTMISFTADEIIEMLDLEEHDPNHDIIIDDIPGIDNTLPEVEDVEKNLPEVEPEITEKDESSN